MLTSVLLRHRTTAQLQAIVQLIGTSTYQSMHVRGRGGWGVGGEGEGGEGGEEEEEEEEEGPAAGRSCSDEECPNVEISNDK